MTSIIPTLKPKYFFVFFFRGSSEHISFKKNVKKRPLFFLFGPNFQKQIKNMVDFEGFFGKEKMWHSLP